MEMQTGAQLNKFDMTQWKYNTAHDVYWQIGIAYCANPADASYENLGIYIPGAYMVGTENGNGTYTCEINPSGRVGAYTAETAPMVIPVNTPGYSAMAAPSGYDSSTAVYTEAGFIYVHAGCRGRDAGAPAGVADLKAAIRYIRYNSDLIPGSTDRLFTFGMSGGGAQSALLGATGDSELYTPYLETIGAVSGNSDAVTGSMCWCPITDLDYADEAYEWNMGVSRTGLSEEMQQISDGLAIAYAHYINELGLKDEAGNVLFLSESTEGIYQSGSYYEYLKEVIETSLNHFLEDITFPYTNQSSKPSGIALSDTYETAQDYIDALNADHVWIYYNSIYNTAKIKSVEDFVAACKKASKSLGAFDQLDGGQIENTLFGYGDGKGAHFDAVLAGLLKGTEYEGGYLEDLERVDALGNTVAGRLNMYKPLYYLSQHYDGHKTSTVAPYWRIRTGINQSDTALSTEVNLALALRAYGVEVDFETVWGQGHVEAERWGDSTSNFIQWVHECCK